MKSYVKIFCLFLALNFGFVPLVCSNNIEVQRVLNTGTINVCITQDKDGLFLIGTQGGGLLSYNGNEAKKIKIIEGRNLYQMVPSVFVDSEGIIWAFMQSQGLFSYDKNSGLWKNYKADARNPATLTSNNAYWPATLITEDREGLIWVGTSDGVNSYNKKTGKFTQYRHISGDNNSLSNNCIRVVFIDKDGLVWMGTENGLNSYDKKTRKISRYKHDPNNANSLSNNSIYTIGEDSRGTIWIGTENGGVCSFNKQTKVFKSYRHDPKNPNSISYDGIRHIMIDRFDNLWISNLGSTGLDKYDTKTNTFKNYKNNPNNLHSINSNQVLYSFEDNTGIVWLVDSSGGVSKCLLDMNIFKNYSHNPEDPFSITADSLAGLYKDKRNNIWIGTYKGGLCLYNANDKFEKFSHVNNDPSSLPSSTVYSITDAPNGKLWVGNMGDFISLFDPETKRVIKSFKDPYSMDTPCNLVVDNKKPELLWFSSYFAGGLFNLNTTTGEFFQYKHDPSNIHSVSNQGTFGILQDGNILWISTGGDGLIKFDKTTEKCTSYKHDPGDKNSISDNVVYQSYVDSKGNFWITTDNGGLNRFDRQTGKFTHYGTECGFPSNSTKHILEGSDGCLWISTDFGIVKFDPNKLEVIKWFTTADGLPSNNFKETSNAIKDANGNFWFPTIKGLCRFNPEKAGKLEPNKHIPPIVLSSFRSKEGTYNEDGLRKLTDIKLAWFDNSFEFTFAALDYTDPQKNKYSYKLEGFDGDWNYTGTHRFGKYTNISPGEYILRLKGANNDRVWNEEGISIKITITPPFWMTPWFKVLTGVFVLSVVGGAFHLRIRALKRKAIHLREHAIAEATAQVTHDIRSPLAALNTALKDLKELPEQKRIMIRNATRRISDIANNLLMKYKVKETTTITKGEEQKNMNAELIPSLLEYLVSEKRIQLTEKSIEIVLELGNNTHSCFVNLEPDKFKRVISNLINNATEAIDGTGGIIRLTLEKNENALAIKIIDNGRGISEDVLSKIKQEEKVSNKKEGFGLGISSAIQSIKSWGGSYDIKSKEGSGTTFTIILPTTKDPDWFQGLITISSNTHIVVLDDDESIHDIWQTSFSEYIANKSSTLHHFYEPLAFIEYCKTSCLEDNLFLVDYELANSKETGLNLIEQLNLKNQAILVTSRYEEEEIKERVKELGIRIIPKSFAPYIPISIKQ